MFSDGKIGGQTGMVEIAGEGFEAGGALTATKMGYLQSLVSNVKYKSLNIRQCIKINYCV